MALKPSTVRDARRTSALSMPDERRRLAVFPVPSQRRPSHPQRLVDRPRLVSRLQDAVEPVIVLQAPVGWGKTTLLQQWTAQDRRNFHWVSLNADQDDALFMAAQLLIAFDVDTAERERLLAGAVRDPAFFAAVTLQRLSDIWSTQTEPHVLIFDGMQRVSSPDVLHLLVRLAENPPAHSKIVLSGRARMGLPLARWLASEHALWLNQDDLSMTAEEDAEVLAKLGVHLGDEQRALLREETQGWPAAVFLAARYLADAGDTNAALFGFPARAVPITEYIGHELLAALPAHLVRFLEECSGVDVLSADICDAMREAQDSGDCLSELERWGLPEAAPPQHGNRDGFACHPLVRQALSSQRHAYEPEQERRAHERAARWLGQQGRYDEAIPHAVVAGTSELAANLLWRWAPDALARGQRSRVEGRLRRFAESEVLARPELSIIQAHCALQAGRPAVPWISAAKQALTEESSTERVGSLHTAFSIAVGILTPANHQQMMSHARSAYSSSHADDPWRSFACYLYGTASHYAEEVEAAEELLEEGQRLSKLLDQPTSEALCISRQSLLAADRGDWERSEMLADRALLLVTERGLSEIATIVPVYLAAALNRAHERSGDLAVKLARRGARLLSYAAPRIASLSVEGNTLLGRIYVLLGDVAAARLALAEAQGALDHRFKAPLFARYLDEARSIAASSPVGAQLGPSTITTAELRVLHLLPTHLSFDEIGHALFLSRNTVKTQAISVYRKLGVRSRSDAVETARKLGLLARS